MKKLTQNKRLIVALTVGVLVLVGVVFMRSRDNNQVGKNEEPLQITPAPEPINLIPVSDRPYVTLEPLSGRNELELVIHELKVPADSVEVTLEYDRNEGIDDAILRNFTLESLPLERELFLGSQSAGGHITYHDDVIGGQLTLDFQGENPYRLRVPWRYDDKQPSYQEFGTSDGRFQFILENPLRSGKIVVMQSPGLPENVDNELLAGPYLVRSVGSLPDTTTEVSIRLETQTDTAVIQGWDGQSWIELDTTVEGRTLTASDDLFQVYIATN